jgi:uncharacterized protein (DUF4415 family)
MGKRERLTPEDDIADRPMSDAEWTAAPRVPREDVAKLLGRPPLPDDEKKQRVTMYLDRDVVDRLKEGGKGWQTRANAKLREVLGL